MCLFFCVRNDCQKWYEGLFSRVWVRVAHLVWTYGLIGLRVAAGYSFRENIYADLHCDPRDARLAVRLCTTDGAPADCVEHNHQIQGGPKSQCGHSSVTLGRGVSGGEKVLYEV